MREIGPFLNASFRIDSIQSNDFVQEIIWRAGVTFSESRNFASISSKYIQIRLRRRDTNQKFESQIYATRLRNFGSCNVLDVHMRA